MYSCVVPTHLSLHGYKNFKVVIGAGLTVPIYTIQNPFYIFLVRPSVTPLLPACFLSNAIVSMIDMYAGSSKLRLTTQCHAFT